MSAPKTDPRLGDLFVHTSDIQEGDLVLASYPDDEGVRLSKGRPGAADGPHEILQHLKRMTPHLWGKESPRRWVELPDMGLLTLDLAKRHEKVRKALGSALKAKAKWVGLGGGHDYGYPDAKAYCEWCRENNQRPLIVNFDAHLDVRDTSKGLTSGTPFYRLLSEEKDLDFLEIGIQAHCNAKTHLSWAEAHGAKILGFEEILMAGTSQSITILKFLDELLVKRRSAFISLDMDAISSSSAPGVSAPVPIGLDPAELAKVLDVLFKRWDAKVFSIYEVAPALDPDGRTARLAAQFIHRFA